MYVGIAYNMLLYVEVRKPCLLFNFHFEPGLSPSRGLAITRKYFPFLMMGLQCESALSRHVFSALHVNG